MGKFCFARSWRAGKIWVKIFLLFMQSKNLTTTIPQLIAPYFVTEGIKIKTPLLAMPGIYKFSPDSLIRELDKTTALGISNIILFDVIKDKEKDNLDIPSIRFSLLPETIKSIKHAYPHLRVIADLCVCSATVSGQCRLKENKRYSDRKTLGALKTLALLYAENGVDIISASTMLKNDTASLRYLLDKSGFPAVQLMPCIKFASFLYLPARKIFGTKNSRLLKPYHLPLDKPKEAMQKITSVIKQGADSVMIKPALYNLDIIHEAKNKFNIPIVGFIPSGSYHITKESLLKDPASEKNIVLEELISLKRAGCSAVVTYYAQELASWLKVPH